MFANYAYQNEGDWDAKAKFPWRIAVDDVFLNDPDEQKKLEDDLFEGMLKKPRKCRYRALNRRVQAMVPGCILARRPKRRR
jgi:hypothetical protein